MLAFRSGFAEVRELAGVAAWALAAILALLLPRERLVPSRAGLVALAGLGLLTVWTAIGKSWAPLPDLAGDDLERLLLYDGAFVAALLAFSDPLARRCVQPGLALFAVVVVGYGLAGRFLPGLLEFQTSRSAGGRLDQPLTYWNAMGAVAAIGLVSAVSIAADATRRGLRVAAGAVMPVLGLGLYLSLSRGALLAAVIGGAALLCLVPRRSLLACGGVAAVSGSVAALLVQHYAAVRTLATGGDPERQGVEMLVLTVVLCALAGAATWLAARRIDDPPVTGVPRAGRRAVAALVALALLIPVIGAPLEFRAGDAPRATGTSRLRSADSARYAYWRVALESIPDHPVKGVGPGGYGVLWMRERPIDEVARDAHSLHLETAAELGLPGLAFLALFFGGTFAGAAGALRRRPAEAAGAAAALLTWTVSASVDWMWELPAVAVIGVLLSAALLSSGGSPPEPEGED